MEEKRFEEAFKEAMGFRETLESIEKTANEVQTIDTWDKDKLKEIAYRIRALLPEVYNQGFNDGINFFEKKFDMSVEEW